MLPYFSFWCSLAFMLSFQCFLCVQTDWDWCKKILTCSSFKFHVRIMKICRIVGTYIPYVVTENEPNRLRFANHGCARVPADLCVPDPNSTGTRVFGYRYVTVTPVLVPKVVHWHPLTKRRLIPNLKLTGHKDDTQHCAVRFSTAFQGTLRKSCSRLVLNTLAFLMVG